MRIALVALAGCWQATAPAIVPAPPRATGPAPSVTWSPDTGIATTGLPAVSRDGNVVVFARQDTDGERGNPSLAIIMQKRDDTLAETFDVLDPNTFDTLSVAAVRARLASARDYLATRHVERTLSPMTVWPAPAFDEAGAPHTMTDGTVVVRWSESHLAITLAGRSLVDRPTPKTWLVEDRPMYAGAEEMCSNPAFLGGVAIDRPHRIALLTISYEGTDTCNEPASQHHVIAW